MKGENIWLYTQDDTDLQRYGTNHQIKELKG